MTLFEPMFVVIEGIPKSVTGTIITYQRYRYLLIQHLSHCKGTDPDFTTNQPAFFITIKKIIEYIIVTYMYVGIFVLKNATKQFFD